MTMVKVDLVDGLYHQRNLKFCWLDVENVGFHCTMICVSEINPDTFCSVFILFESLGKCCVLEDNSEMCLKHLVCVLDAKL